MFTLLFRVAIEAGTGGGAPVYLLPTNIIVATIRCTAVARTLETPAAHDLTSDGATRRLTFEG